jgi:hypothetical protein
VLFDSSASYSSLNVRCRRLTVTHPQPPVASLPAHYWAESLYAATYLLNLLPTKAISIPTPHFALFDTTPSYAHLRVFGCACYPNTSATAPHKLAPRSCRCVFLGYSSDHKGYQGLDLITNRMLISTHHFQQVILLLCLLQPTYRRLGLPLLVQSCGSCHCSTLPLFCYRYARATRGLNVHARATRDTDVHAHIFVCTMHGYHS